MPFSIMTLTILNRISRVLWVKLLRKNPLALLMDWVRRLVDSSDQFLPLLVVLLLVLFTYLLFLLLMMIELAINPSDADCLSFSDLCRIGVWKGDGKLDPNLDARPQGSRQHC